MTCLTNLSKKHLDTIFEAQELARQKEEEVEVQEDQQQAIEKRNKKQPHLE